MSSPRHHTRPDDTPGWPGGFPPPSKRGASGLASLHSGLQIGLANLNRRLFGEGTDVVAYSTWFDDDYGKDVIVLLWRTPPRAAAGDDVAIRRCIEATDEELSLIESAVIAHQFLGPGRANERPKGAQWMEVAPHSDDVIAATRA